MGIAFGGGSLHGMAHVGVVKALTEMGLRFQFIAGTSAGCIIGVLAAAKMPYDEIHEVARQIEWPGLMAISWSRKGLLRHTKLRSLIDASLGNRQLEQLPIAFSAIATDIATGERIVLRRGPAGEALGLHRLQQHRN